MAQLSQGEKGHSGRDRLPLVSSLSLTSSHIWRYCKKKKKRQAQFCIERNSIHVNQKSSAPSRPYIMSPSSVLAHTAVFLQGTNGCVVPFKDRLPLGLNRHAGRGKCLFQKPLNVYHAEAPPSINAWSETHLIFNDFKVIVKVHNSKFHWKYKGKDSKAFCIQHVLAQILFSLSVLLYLCISLFTLEVFRSSPKQPLPAPAFQPQPQLPPHPGLCLGGLYAASGCRNSLLLPGRIIMMCKTVGLVFLQSVHIVKTVE